MDHDKRHQLREAQCRDEILAISEFDFPFPRFDLLPRERVVIFKLQGFRVVNIVGFNSDLTRVGEFALLVTHTKMYTRVQILLRIGDGAKG
jgi:hypothetical protein